jgi:hypothetical protein
MRHEQRHSHDDAVFITGSTLSIDVGQNSIAKLTVESEQNAAEPIVVAYSMLRLKGHERFIGRRTKTAGASEKRTAMR